MIDNVVSSKNPDKIALADIKDFLEKIVAIYTPSRIEIPNDLGAKNIQNAPKVILKDSINNLDAIFNKELENDKNTNLNGIHIFNRLVDDLNNIGGLNHLIPIIELMANSEELLTTQNICSFFNLITIIFTPYYKNALNDEKYSNFFFNLSFFLEKIPDSFFDNQLAIKLISISLFLTCLDKKYINIIQQYHNYILLNEKILFKFHFEGQSIILQQIKYFIDCSQRNDFTIDIMLIINRHFES